jgi:DNA polymerase delta subunit 4
MAPKSGSTTKSKSNSASLKQGTLGFTSAKRTSSAAAAGKGKKPVRTQSTPAARSNVVVDNQSSSEEGGVDETEPSRVEEEVAWEKQQQGQKEEVCRTSAGQKKKSTDGPGVLCWSDGLENSNGGFGALGVERQELQEKDPRWRKQYQIAREKMGTVKPSEYTFVRL